ncbi:MAG: hypothetical protein KGZ58_03375 [Ignavibacteriales bacterium]|nr:hypothetical protein [Ignavibacteriales bacterium]
MSTENNEQQNISPQQFSADVKRTLLYYNLFNYPLTSQQLFTFLPTNSLTFNEFYSRLQNELTNNTANEKDGFVFLSDEAVVQKRIEKEKNAVALLRLAKFMTQIIKRFPFVRAVFLSGELSKNIASKSGDIDFMIVTEEHRLWICRTLLILFKKIFLFNSKKYFCVNYFIDEKHLELKECNIFTATEIAHLKPLFNFKLFKEYFTANDWIKEFFPNFSLARLNVQKMKDRKSKLQRLGELFFQGNWTTTFDSWLMRRTEHLWKSRYPQFDEETRNRIFKCKSYESRAFVLNFEDKVLQRYEQVLKQQNIPVKPTDIQRTE